MHADESTAWNWQQDNRLQWILRSSRGIARNDRSDDGTHSEARGCDTVPEQMRTLPKPIYMTEPTGSAEG